MQPQPRQLLFVLLGTLGWSACGETRVIAPVFAPDMGPAWDLSPQDTPRDLPPDIAPDAGTPLGLPGDGRQALVPANAHEGIMDCVSVNLPEYTLTHAASPLSASYRRLCASCHGPTGAGLDALSEQAYVDAGRTGAHSCGPVVITDAELRSDHGVLGPGLEPRAEAATSVWAWTEAEVEAAYETGLPLWREVGQRGVACADCHSPDAVDLAILGFEDADILRHAQEHVTLPKAATLLDFVHAQRRRFTIGRPCAVTWRPMQPGGEPLEGETDLEQDEAFGEQLVRRRHVSVMRAVETLNDARALMIGMARTDLKRLPIAIALPRWSNRGPDATGSVNDYLMGLGRRPNDPQAWGELEEAYLREPTETNLLALLRYVETETNDLGFFDAHQEAIERARGRCMRMHQQLGQGFLTYVDQAKRRAGLLVQHYMRMELLRQPGWLALGPVPHEIYARAHGEGLNPFYRLGAQLSVYDCTEMADALDAWPEAAAREIPSLDRVGGAASAMSAELNHPWQTLGMLYDPMLYMEESFTLPNYLRDWARIGLVQHRIHHPFLFLHRILSQESYWRNQRNGGMSGVAAAGFHAKVPVHPVLDGSRLYFRQRNFQPALGDQESWRQMANTLRCNGIRAILLLQREQLQAGASGNYIQRLSRNESLFTHYNAWRGWANRFGGGDQSARFLPAFEGKSNLCGQDLVALVDEVRALAMAATDVSD